MNNILTIGKWFASFFDESNPNSFSRFITFVIVSFVLGWDTSFVYHSKGSLPDVGTMAGQVAFMTAFYIVRRAAGAYTDTRTTTPSTDQAAPKP